MAAPVITPPDFSKVPPKKQTAATPPVATTPVITPPVFGSTVPKSTVVIAPKNLPPVQYPPTAVVPQVEKKPASEGPDAVDFARTLSDYNVVQPEYGFESRFGPKGDTSYEQIAKATDKQYNRLYSDENLPETGLNTQLNRISQLTSEPRTFAGDRRITTPSPTTIENVLGTGVVGSVLGALAPQTISSSQDAEELKTRSDEAYRLARSFMSENPQLFQGTQQEIADKFREVQQGFLYEGHAPSRMAKLATNLFTETMPSGAIIESPITTAGKMLNTGEAALVAGGRTGLQVAKGQEITPLKNLTGELKSGQGLMGAGSEMGQAAGASFSAGMSPDAQKYYQDLGSDIGGFAGFGASLLVPVDLGLSSVGAAAAKGASGSVKAAKAFEESSTGVAKAGTLGGLKGGWEGFKDAWWVSPRTGGNSAIADQIRVSSSRFMKSEKLNNVVEKTLELAADPVVQAAINADRKIGQAAKDVSEYSPNQLDEVLRKQYKPSNEFPTFDSFKEAAESYGIDFTNTAGLREARKNTVPENVLSREDVASAGRTSLGTRTTNHFDDISTGGRSDLYYQAMLENLSEEAKKSLVYGKAINKADLLPAIDTFMNDVRKTKNPAEVAAIGAGLRAKLKAQGIDIGERVFGGSSKEVAAGGMILPSNPEARAALNRALVVDTTKKTLNNFTKETGLVGTQRKIGGVTLSSSDAAEVLASIKKNPEGKQALAILNRLQDEASKGAVRAVGVSAEEVKILENYFQEQFKTGIKTSEGKNLQVSATSPLPGYSRYETLATIEGIKNSGTVSVAELNNLIRGSIAIESSGKISAKSASDITGIAESLKSEERNAEYQYFATQVFKPKDFAPNAFGALLTDQSRRFTNAPSKSVVANEIVKEINQKMGALSDRFKISMRARENALAKEGVPMVQRKPRAFAETIVSEYSSAWDAATIKLAAEEMFRTNFAAMFGGYEKTLDMVATTGRVAEATSSGKITVQEMRDLVSVMMELPGLRHEVDLFVDAVQGGRDVEAINLLQKIHAKYFGFSIEQIVTKSKSPAASIREALEAAETTATVDRLGRSPLKSFETASTQGMVIPPSNFKEMLVANYFSKAQANIVDETMKDAASKYPMLFPSKAVIGDIANKDYEVVKAGLISGLTKAGADRRLIDWITQSTVDKQRLLIAAITDEIAAHGLTVPKKTSYAKELMKQKTEQEVASYRARFGPNAQEDHITAIISRNEKYTNDIKLITDNLSSTPGSTWSQVYGSTLNVEMNNEAYRVALSELKNQLKSPWRPAIQGAAEKVKNIPILAREAQGIKGPLIRSVNLKSITDTMESITLAESAGKLDEVVATNGDQVVRDLSEAQSRIDDILTAEMKDVESTAALKEKIMKTGNTEYRKVALTVSDYLKQSAKSDSIVSKTIGLTKSGMLSGNALPNMVYMMNNIISAPAIIMSQLGIREGLKSMGTFLDIDLHRIMASVYAPGSVVDAADRVIVRAPDGTIHTTSMFRDYITNGVVGQSQASAELSNSLINDAIKWAGETGLIGDTSAAKKFFYRNFLNTSGVNMWSTIANICDQYYRVGVLKRALASGEQLPQASKLAREALFDYGNITAGERSLISKTVWFWSFRRNNWRSLLVSALNDPRALKAAFNQRRGWSYAASVMTDTNAYAASTKEDPYQDHKDYMYVMDKYSESKAFFHLVEDKENQRRYALYGPAIPQVQAVADLVDLLSVPLAYVVAKNPSSTESSSMMNTVREGLTKGVQNSNPFIQGVAGAVFGMNMQDGSDLGTYLDPRLMWYTRNTPAGRLFDVFVATEPVPQEEEKTGVGTFNGQQWRIVKGDDTSIRNWSLIRTALMTGGVQRMLTDNAAMLDMMTSQESENPDMKLSTGDTVIDILRNLGIVGVSNAPTIGEIARQNRYAAARDIADVSNTELPPSERKTQ
ncbi:hypothetical protein UFOVP1228_34 [uncultured Caudovirales phage]|uniref:Large polyvalent protein associated domain-containing protein n=1 Tax=uncultured Caudovirales phage TaxID=2100421 RepID=A0A6J5SL21_9CAUD|nr:hypothetical protein UFOVP956_34 [uncultured Caudovirales phage]CAB4191449.1 hypothetical protein UFOVP1228_34 [uncultured Caudovirales phage]CAB4215256.1 hypothetical protein UFOVP1481_4 [uncultured Caudovirales phage]